MTPNALSHLRANTRATQLQSSDGEKLVMYHKYMLLVAEGKKQLSKEADPKEREKIQEGITNNERGAYELRTEIHSNHHLTTLLKRPGLYNAVVKSIQYPVLA